MAESELWTIAQIAAFTGKPWRKCYDLVLTGKFGEPERRGVRTWLVPADNVREYVEQRAAATAKAAAK